MPRAVSTARSGTTSAPPISVGGTATLERASPTAARVIWQASPDYRLVIANNPLGFSIQMLDGSTWKTVEGIPAFALRPMLMQFGLIHAQLGAYASNGGSSVKPVTRTSTPTKTSTVSRA